MRRYANALTALLFGIGILVCVVGLFTDQYSWQIGVIGLVAAWVLAFALRVFLVGRSDD
jgi:hypothetical protein